MLARADRSFVATAMPRSYLSAGRWPDSCFETCLPTSREPHISSLTITAEKRTELAFSFGLRRTREHSAYCDDRSFNVALAVNVATARILRQVPHEPVTASDDPQEDRVTGQLSTRAVAARVLDELPSLHSETVA
jgi:hypothetical protein